MKEDEYPFEELLWGRFAGACPRGWVTWRNQRQAVRSPGSEEGRTMTTTKPYESDGGRLASFTCPRCGYLPDRFFSRRLSAQLRLNRTIIIGFALVQLGGIWILQQHLTRADQMRSEVSAKLDQYRRECRP